MFDFFGELKKLKKLEKFFAKLILFSGAQGSKGKRQMFWSTILLALVLSFHSLSRPSHAPFTPWFLIFNY